MIKQISNNSTAKCIALFTLGFVSAVNAWDATPERGEATRKLYGNGDNSASSASVASDNILISPRFGEIPAEYFCQTADSRWDVPSHLDLMYSPETFFGPYGESATAELDLSMRFLAWHGFLNGTFEGSLHTKMLSFLSNPDMEALPDVASQVNLDVFASWRFENFWIMELGASPGIYSDITAPAFSCPFTVNFHHVIAPSASFMLGATGRIGWDLPVMPNVGFAWQPFGFFRMEAGLPRSIAEISIYDTVVLFGTVEWRNYDFALADEEGLPDSFTVDEWLATAGIFISPSADGHGFSAEFGTYLNREISSDDVSDNSTVEIEKEWIARLSWHGGF